MNRSLYLGMIVGWLMAAATSPSHALTEQIGAFYRADVPFPEYFPFWQESWSLKAATGETLQYAQPNMPHGGSVHLFVRNGGDKPARLTDVRLQGVSLKRAVAFSEQKLKRVLRPASLYFSDLTADERGRLLAAGEPIWWRVQPPIIPPGGTAEVTVRLRRTPDRDSLTVALDTTAGLLERSVPIVANAPRMVGIAISPELDRVYLYVTRLDEDPTPPSQVWFDGEEMTSLAGFGTDAKASLFPVVVKLEQPLEKGSFHCFQVGFESGRVASTGVRAWHLPFAYGMWGSRPGREGDDETARQYLGDLHEHTINLQMEHIGSGAVRVFLKSEEGQRLLEQLGIQRMVSDIGKGNTKHPWTYFLVDEPDVGDYRVKRLKPNLRVGSLAQSLVERSRELRAADPLTPHYLNVDLTYKPDNWYIYGQLPDIFASDPYYQERIRDAYYLHPDRLPLYTRATYVYAVGQVAQSACAPRPLHLILNSVHHIEEDEPFRFGTPEEKRAEVYYALAAGAKGLSYWWYTPSPPYLGVGADDPGARALWDEIGQLGVEVRTAGPVLVRSCPALLPVKATRRLWVRTLLAGLDTLVVLAVNEDYASDRVGTVVRPLERAEVTVELPQWLDPKDVFEIRGEGLHSVPWEADESKLRLDLGRVELTRMLMLTADPTLRARLQAQHESLPAGLESSAIGKKRSHGHQR